MRRYLPQRSLALLCCGVLAVSIVGLVAAFLLSMARARYDFERAAVSEEQLAAVAQIEAALSSGGQGSLGDLLQQYRRSIDREAALLGRADERAAEAAEATRADRLAALAQQPESVARNRAIRRLVAAISSGERVEAGEVARRMEQLRRRMTLLAVLLTGTALISAALGAVGLAAANRRLSGEVAARTGELATIERSRRLFFAKVSHELRTPVTVMRGEAEVALSAPDGHVEPLREALDRVVAHAEFLERRIEELLSLAQAENGELRLEDGRVDLTNLIEGARHAAAAYARALEVGIAIDGPARPAAIRGDARWLQQALVAVLDNAAKFSPVGSSVSLRAAADDRTATISIGDEGPGIPPGELPRIFDAYYQAEGGRARGGTGLGLALARWVIERHGGAITAGNGEASGCVMTITLPVAP